MTLYPKLKKKLGLIGALCLIVWGLFILGMQTYVFGYYSQVYGEGKGPDGKDVVWSNAYNGMALANCGACLLFGMFYIVAFTAKQTTTKMLLWGMILAVVGAGAAAASTVLSAIESDWLNTATNDVTTHPCKEQGTDGKPSELVCTNWLALEVTVAVLSGLAFTEYIFIACVIFMGLSGGKYASNDGGQQPLQNAPIVRITNNNVNKKPVIGGHEGPYNAFNQSPPESPKGKSTASNYDDFNPQYSYHLQQLSLQQQAQQQQIMRPNNYNSKPPSSVHHQESTGQRGRLQVLHNQRQRGPAPPVPSKPNSSNLYRY